MTVPDTRELTKHTEEINELLARYGVKFGLYKQGVFKEQLFPFDAIPRIISAEDFAGLERGLKQRVMALNCFIADIYGEKKIIRDKVVPEEFVFDSPGYLAQCEGTKPPGRISPASTWCRRRTAAGSSWRTTCACPPARPIR